MAVESQESARSLQDRQYRSCASRMYYSAYQAVTAVLLYQGCVPPNGREAWKQRETPDILKSHFQGLIVSRDKRIDMARRLGSLYKLSIIADYFGQDDTDSKSVKKAMKDANFLLKVTAYILPSSEDR